MLLRISLILSSARWHGVTHTVTAKLQRPHTVVTVLATLMWSIERKDARSGTWEVTCTGTGAGVHLARLIPPRRMSTRACSSAASSNVSGRSASSASAPPRLDASSSRCSIILTSSRDNGLPMPPLSMLPADMPRVVATPNASNGTRAAAPTKAATPRPCLSSSMHSSLPARLKPAVSSDAVLLAADMANAAPTRVVGCGNVTRLVKRREELAPEKSISISISAASPGSLVCPGLVGVPTEISLRGGETSHSHLRVRGARQGHVRFRLTERVLLK